MTIREIYQYNSGGIVYKDANGNILGTGTSQDSAAPDPADQEGIFIYCQSPARTLYIVVNQQLTYRVKNSAPVIITPTTQNQILAILSENFFFKLSGGGPETQNLDDVLTIGNNAGANDIDMNGNDISFVDELEVKIIKSQPASDLELNADLDLILNPTGSIDANGKTLNMTGGEIHNVPLIHSKNNTDLTIEGKGTGDIILKTNNTNRLYVSDSAGISFSTYADLSGNDIKNINNASGKTNADLNIEALGTGGLNIKTGGATRLTIKDGGQFVGLPQVIQTACSDETTALTTGTAKVTFRMPYQFKLTAVRASLTTAQTSGSIFTVDINQSGSSVLGTKLTIDNTEKTSTTAATPATITTSILNDDAEITIDIDQIGNGTAKGLKITLIGFIQ